MSNNKLWNSEFLITVFSNVETVDTESGYAACTLLLTGVVDQVMRTKHSTFVKPEQDSMACEFEMYDSDGTLAVCV